MKRLAFLIPECKYVSIEVFIYLFKKQHLGTLAIFSYKKVTPPTIETQQSFHFFLRHNPGHPWRQTLIAICPFPPSSLLFCQVWKFCT